MKRVTIPPAASVTRHQWGRPTARMTGPIASRAHCFVAIARPSSNAAHTSLPRSPATTAPTHIAPPSSSSG